MDKTKEKTGTCRHPTTFSRVKQSNFGIAKRHGRRVAISVRRPRAAHRPFCAGDPTPPRTPTSPSIYPGGGAGRTAAPKISRELTSDVVQAQQTESSTRPVSLKPLESRPPARRRPGPPLYIAAAPPASLSTRPPLPLPPH